MQQPPHPIEISTTTSTIPSASSTPTGRGTPTSDLSTLHQAVWRNLECFRTGRGEQNINSKVQDFLNSGSDVNSLDKLGRTPLSYYAEAELKVREEAKKQLPGFDRPTEPTIFHTAGIGPSFFELLARGANLDLPVSNKNASTLRSVFEATPALARVLQGSFDYQEVAPAVDQINAGQPCEPGALNAFLLTLLDQFAYWELIQLAISKGAKLETTQADAAFRKAIEIGDVKLADALIAQCNYPAETQARYAQFRRFPSTDKFSIERPRSPPPQASGTAPYDPNMGRDQDHWLSKVASKTPSLCRIL